LFLLLEQVKNDFPIATMSDPNMFWFSDESLCDALWPELELLEVAKEMQLLNHYLHILKTFIVKLHSNI
jgi:hypothetical protein